jgi:hypothetical protein
MVSTENSGIGRDPHFPMGKRLPRLPEGAALRLWNRNCLGLAILINHGPHREPSRHDALLPFRENDSLSLDERQQNRLRVLLNDAHPAVIARFAYDPKTPRPEMSSPVVCDARPGPRLPCYAILVTHLVNPVAFIQVGLHPHWPNFLATSGPTAAKDADARGIGRFLGTATYHRRLRFLTRSPRCEPLAFDGLESCIRALRVIYTKRSVVVVAKIELGKIAVQTIGAALLIKARHATLEHAEETFNRVGVRIAALILMGAVVYGLVLRERLRDLAIHTRVVSHERGVRRHIRLECALDARKRLTRDVNGGTLPPRSTSESTVSLRAWPRPIFRLVLRPM